VTVGVWLVAGWGSMASIWLGAVALAVGMSLMYPSLFTAVMAAAPESERTHAVGTFSVFFDLSTGLGATIVGLVVSLSGERGGFAVAGALAAAGLAAQWVLRDRIGRRHLQPVAATGADQAA
jgi:MFS family permease